MNQLEEIFTTMMDEGNHDELTQVPYNLVGGVFIFDNRILSLDTLAYNVNTGSNKDGFTFDNFMCSQTDSFLECNEQEMFGTIEELEDSITLGEVVNVFSNVDIIDIIEGISDNFNIYTSKPIMIDLRFNNIDEVNSSLANSEYKIVFYGEELHYQDSYVANDIMLKITLYIETDNNTEIFEVFYEID